MSLSLAPTIIFFLKLFFFLKLTLELFCQFFKKFLVGFIGVAWIEYIIIFKLAHLSIWDVSWLAVMFYVLQNFIFIFFLNLVVSGERNTLPVFYLTYPISVGFLWFAVLCLSTPHCFHLRWVRWSESCYVLEGLGRLPVWKNDCSLPPMSRFQKEEMRLPDPSPSGQTIIPSRLCAHLLEAENCFSPWVC